MSPGKRTYAELDRLLAALDFRVAQSPDLSRTYWHEPSDTIILVRAETPGATVSEADLMSVRVRLAGRGLLDRSAFEAFVENGALPAA